MISWLWGFGPIFQCFTHASESIDSPLQSLWQLMISWLWGFGPIFQYVSHASEYIDFLLESIWIFMFCWFWCFRPIFQYIVISFKIWAFSWDGLWISMRGVGLTRVGVSIWDYNSNMGLRQPSPASQPSPIWIASSAKLAIHASQPAESKKMQNVQRNVGPELGNSGISRPKVFFILKLNLWRPGDQMRQPAKPG